MSNRVSFKFLLRKYIFYRFQDGIVNMAEWKDHSMRLLDYHYSQGNSFHFAIYTGCCKAPNAKELPILWKEHKNSLLKFITRVSLILKKLLNLINFSEVISLNGENVWQGKKNANF